MSGALNLGYRIDDLKDFFDYCKYFSNFALSN
jgi:hypothetical protein